MKVLKNKKQGKHRNPSNAASTFTGSVAPGKRSFVMPDMPYIQNWIGNNSTQSNSEYTWCQQTLSSFEKEKLLIKLKLKNRLKKNAAFTPNQASDRFEVSDHRDKDCSDQKV